MIKNNSGNTFFRAGATVLLIFLLLFSTFACGNEEAVETEHPAETEPSDDSAPGFYEAAEGEEILCFIEDLDRGTGVLTFDQVEWLTLEDTDRIDEIGLDPDVDMPGGFYIYNETDQLYRLNTAEDVTVYLLDWSDLSTPHETDLAELEDRLGEYQSPFLLSIENELVVSIQEVYTP